MAIALMLLALAGSSQAADVRLDQNGGVFEKLIPVYNQGSYPSCFAHATSELIDAYRFGVLKDSDPSFLTSPHMIFLRMNQYREEYQGERIPFTLEMATITGACSYRALHPVLEKKQVLAENDLIPALLALKTYWESIPKDWKVTHRRTHGREMLEAAQPYLPGLQCIMEQHGLPMPEKDSYYRYVIAQSLRNEGRADFFLELLSSVCKERGLHKNLEALPKPTIKTLKETQRDFSLEKQYISAVLTQGQPIAVSFCSTVLRRKPFSGFMGKTADAHACEEKGHAALIIGLRETKVDGKKRHQFLLRNSWGIGCDAYPKRRADCESAGKGNLWIDTEELLYNSYELTSLVGA